MLDCPDSDVYHIVPPSIIFFSLVLFADAETLVINFDGMKLLEDIF
jgi:hypothetical protein